MRCLLLVLLLFTLAGCNDGGSKQAEVNDENTQADISETKAVSAEVNSQKPDLKLELIESRYYFDNGHFDGYVTPKRVHKHETR